MPRIPNKFGGGARTNVNGLSFEQTTSLTDALISAGYDVRNNSVYCNDLLIGMSLSKNELYKHFLIPRGINYEDHISKRLYPDDAFINFANNTVYIIEKKFQNTSGSVDEKLTTCSFKKDQYKKLITPLDFHVQYIYVLNDWFKHPSYKDTLDYINDVGCFYYFNEIPLCALGL